MYLKGIFPPGAGVEVCEVPDRTPEFTGNVGCLLKRKEKTIQNKDNRNYNIIPEQIKQKTGLILGWRMTSFFYGAVITG